MVPVRPAPFYKVFRNFARAVWTSCARYPNARPRQQAGLLCPIREGRLDGGCGFVAHSSCSRIGVFIRYRAPDIKAVETSPDVLLVTVTDVETRAVFDTAQSITGKPFTKHFLGKKTYYDLGLVCGTSVYLVRSEMSSTSVGGSMITVLHGIELLQPGAVIIVGIAFGVDESAQPIGTVLISQQIQNYDLARVGTAADGGLHVVSRGDRPPASQMLLDRFRDAAFSWDTAESGKFEFGLLLSGSALIDNLGFRDELRKLAPEAIGGEMEGSGAYVAAEQNKTDWIIAKAVCDYADGHKRTEKAERQANAARSASQFVFHVISQGGLTEAATRGAYGIPRTVAIAPPPDVQSGSTSSGEAASAAPAARLPQTPPVRESAPLGEPVERPPSGRAVGPGPWSRFATSLRRFGRELVSRSESGAHVAGHDVEREELYHAFATLRGDFAVESVVTSVTIGAMGAAEVRETCLYRAYSRGFRVIQNRATWEAPILPGSQLDVTREPAAAGGHMLLGPTLGPVENGRMDGYYVDWVLEFADYVPAGESIETEFRYVTEPDAARHNLGDVDEYVYEVRAPTKSIEIEVAPAMNAPFILIGGRAIVSIPGSNPELNHTEAQRVRVSGADGAYRYKLEYPLPGSSVRFVWTVGPRLFRTEAPHS
jgi:nucleoside phosphorylase